MRIIGAYNTAVAKIDSYSRLSVFFIGKNNASVFGCGKKVLFFIKTVLQQFFCQKSAGLDYLSGTSFENNAFRAFQKGAVSAYFFNRKAVGIFNFSVFHFFHLLNTFREYSSF